MGKYYFGIDFGTTNSATVSLSLPSNNFETYGDSEGTPYPSFVAIDKTDGRVYKDRESWNKRFELQEHCEIIRSVKTYLNDPNKSWNIAGRVFTPEDIVVEILEGLKKKVKDTGNNLTEAVMAIPVGFNAYSRKVLRRAAKRAGINILSFISEPTAAYFSYYDALKHYKKIIVFDWGGGTLDISLLLVEGNYVSEIVTLGHNFAGDDIDKKLAEYIHTKLDTQNISFDQMSSTKKDLLIMKCERAKKELSNQEETTLYFTYNGPVDLTLKRTEFNNLIIEEIEKIRKKIFKALRRAGWNKEEVDKIVLVGGSCNIPLLREMMYDDFGEKVYSPKDPDWSIAIGAAMLAKEPGNYVAAHEFGVILSDDSFFPLIKKAERINNLAKSFSFGLVEDAESANLIFAERSKNGDFKRIGKYMDVPCFGFIFEPIEVKVVGNDDLIVKVEAKSKNRANEYKREVAFEDVIKFRYKLPEVIK